MLIEARGHRHTQRDRLTFCVHRHIVGPVVPSRVSTMARACWALVHSTLKYLNRVLSAQIHACGRVGHLRYVEKLEQVLDLNGHRTGARPDDPHDGLLSGRTTKSHPHSAPGLPSPKKRWVPYELDALLQGHGRVPAGVPDLAAQCDVGQERGVQLILSRVCSMASTRWMPYCSRTARTCRVLSTVGWWWTENRAPMMMSPGMCAQCTLRSLDCAPPTDIFFQKQDWQDQQKDHFREGVQANKDSMV